MMNKTDINQDQITIISFLLLFGIFSIVIFSLYNSAIEHEKKHLSAILKGEVLVVESLFDNLTNDQTIFQKNTGIPLDGPGVEITLYIAFQFIEMKGKAIKIELRTKHINIVRNFS